jgi:hypothetical protein
MKRVTLFILILTASLSHAQTEFTKFETCVIMPGATKFYCIATRPPLIDGRFSVVRPDGGVALLTATQLHQDKTVRIVPLCTGKSGFPCWKDYQILREPETGK